MHKLRFLFVLAGFALASCVVSQVVPQKVGETFRVSDDLEIALWASEPLLTNPTCIDVDHLGRVWVCESVNYRTKLHNKPVNRAAGDRIVILSDPKGVGRAEEAITFYQSPDLQAPLGIAVAKDPVGPGWKVYVCHSPDLLLFEDKDGDGKADGPPTKLLSGFKGFDHDHGLHGVSIGPDGKLYFSVGDQGVAGLVDKDGKTWRTNNSDCRAGTIWRCDLDGRNLEFLAHNFRNQYEPCVDSFGTIFVSDNDDDGNQQTRICLVMPGGNYGYHPRGKGESHWHEEQPGVVPLILRTGFGSPTGMCVYEGYQLPARFRGRLLHTDAGPRHVRLYTPRVSGAGYSLEREDIVQSTDTWFRPSDVCVAPDGSVFIADWYDPGVGGHGMGDIQRGRIYRLTAKGIGQPKTPPVDLETPEGLRRALASPALAVRHMAMAKLQAMAPKAAAALLEEIATATDNPVLRARALWQLARLGRLRPLAIAFRDPDPRFRILTIRALKEFQNVSPADYTDDWQTALLMDTPEVRREALLALRDVEAARAKPILLKLAKRHDGKDRFYVAAVGIAVGTDGKRREALLGTFNTDFPEWDDVTAHLAWELRPPAVLPRLEQLVTAPKITPRQRLQAIQTLAAFDGVEGGRALLRGLASPLSLDMREVILDEGRRLLPGKWAPLKKAPELNQAVEALWANAETRRLALSLIGIAEKSDALSRVVGVVQNAGQPFDLRVAAIHCLGQLPDAAAVKALTDLLPSAPDPLRTAIITALGAQAGGAANRPPTIPALQALQALVQNKETPPGLGQAAVAALAGTRAGA
ncbi:MAG: HEAT repeat domain-containing protein, partial [Gemmataceae bacterium]|nr:HEAT repeat domain-containing protein [Gemmataceae bacterium]